MADEAPRTVKASSLEIAFLLTSIATVIGIILTPREEMHDLILGAEKFFDDLPRPTGRSTYEIVEDLSFFDAFQKLGIDSIRLPDGMRDSIVHAGGFIDYGDERGATAYTVTQNTDGLVTVTEAKPGTDTNSYFEWRVPTPLTVEAEAVEIERLDIPRDTPPPAELAHDLKPKIDYDLAERNLQGISHRYNSSAASDELVRGMQYGAAHYADGAVTLTQEEALSALQNGTFTKDGVRWEVWESKAYPGTFYITKLPV